MVDSTSELYVHYESELWKYTNEFFWDEKHLYENYCSYPSESLATLDSNELEMLIQFVKLSENIGE